jgi:hypothetical protein
MLVVAVLLVSTGVVRVPVAAARQTPATQSATPATTGACPVAADPAYGLTAGKPIRIGGGPVYMNARERRFVDALRGPAGEAVLWDGSVGSGPAKLSDTVGVTIIDSIPVTYAGHDQPIRIYIDVYHFDPPMAPTGFTCGKPFELSPPPLDPFKASKDLAALAIEQGAARAFTPIVLSASEAPRVEVMDQFRVLAHLARSAAASGSRLDPEHPPRAGSAVLAYAKTCDGRTIVPTAIDIIAAQGPPVQRGGPYLNETTVASVLPNLQLPEGTLVATYALGQLRPTDVVRVSYSETPCGNSEKTIDLRVQATQPRPRPSPPPRLPQGYAPTAASMLIQALIDTDGRVQRPSYVGGPEDLIPAAMDAVRELLAEPARINGAPIVTPTMIPLRFAPQ